MRDLKEEAIQAISKLPKNANLDDIVYQLYLLAKVKKGQEDVRKKKLIPAETLKSEI